ncbi:PREDICTED: putative cysteine-rich receptor-like protein kinase 9 [Camelina sativa]|uniref:Cysteine-rich receptor-like protein kinase 9 n=1 Tax=Camelina sativa TaxID=90675 RepID=A0ABM0SPI3_CAMSA|nr:PREDICTED: putative cysteine-rich receptor-like protein kinase 9 [Camelina sativa]
MSSFASFIFLFVLFFLSIIRASVQDLTLLHYVCPSTATYTRNSTYYNNLTTLLSFFSSRNASYSTGFQNATVGQEPDMVTGLFLCGGVSPESCRDCVVFAVNQSLNRCPNQRQAVLYYDECMLRYSHRNILSTLRTIDGYTLSSLINIPTNQQESFRGLVLSMMNQAAREAAASSRKLGAIKANFNASQTLYGLVHCTPDLTAQDCSLCLKTSISQLPTERIGARVLLPSCNSRYELYPFYNESVISSSTLRSPPPTPPARDGQSSLSTSYAFSCSKPKFFQN